MAREWSTTSPQSDELVQLADAKGMGGQQCRWGGGYVAEGRWERLKTVSKKHS